MRRLIILLLLLHLFALPAYAQEPTPDPADAAAACAAADAERAADQGANMLGIFEAVGTSIGILTGVVVPLIAVIGGLAGLRSLRDARAELSAARDQMLAEVESIRTKMNDELGEKQAELDALRKVLEASALDERIRSEQATLALSLIPLAERQYRVDDYGGALDTYQRALVLDPDNMVIHYRLGYVYTQMRKLDEATHHLDHVLRVDANFAPALANLGYVLRLRAEQMPQDNPKRGQLLAEAEQKLRQALEISPKLVDEDGESWWGVLGGLHRRRGQVDDAIDAYNRALEATPHASYPLGNLALLYMQKHDRERMVETYRRVERIAAQRTRMEGADHWAWADLLVAQLALGHFDAAQDTLESLLAAVPDAAPDQLRSPLSTIHQLASIIGGRQAEGMQPFIERIEAQLSWNGQGQK
jgi:tetratricopeptide (TPR) repeat protein